MKVEMAVSIHNCLIVPVAMPMIAIVDVFMIVPQPIHRLGLGDGLKNELGKAPNRCPQ